MKKLIIIISIIILIIIIVGIIIMLPGKEKTNKDLSGLSVATFAGGCFWCVEADFQKLRGVVEVLSGYTGGEIAEPSYKQVSAGGTGHREAVQVYYNPDIVEYRDLVRYLFAHIDPTDEGGSFGDRGEQYSSAIYYTSDEEKNIAEEEKKLIDESGVFESKVVTSILPVSKFYLAEEYHQDYGDRNSIRYKYYRGGSGRDDFLEKTWEGDKPSVKKYLEETNGYDISKLTDLQYRVTQKNATEPPFDNKYNSEKRDGIYVDIVSGQALFSSTDKFDSGTGWPSFTRPIDEANVSEKEDKSLFTTRTEARSSQADSHLGHVFNDGPAPSGERFCINSAALDFVAKEDLEERGYGEYLSLFD